MGEHRKDHSKRQEHKKTATHKRTRSDASKKFEAPRNEKRSHSHSRNDKQHKFSSDRPKKNDYSQKNDHQKPRHDDPAIPEDLELKDLDWQARVTLKTLSKENADWVAQHLLMVSKLIDAHPELALRHAQAAVRRAGRVAIVRETLGIVAYTLGDFSLALRELRTYQRISGSFDQIPLIVDSERGMGRPERAIELGHSVERENLPVSVQVYLSIALAGARCDLGQFELAKQELEIKQLDADWAYSWSEELFRAYADVLETLGEHKLSQLWQENAKRAAEACIDDDDVQIIQEEYEP